MATYRAPSYGIRASSSRYLKQPSMWEGAKVRPTANVFEVFALNTRLDVKHPADAFDMRELCVCKVLQKAGSPRPMQ
jgi:hypothetical protein